MTGKEPAVLLILENPTKEEIYLKGLTTVANKYKIKVFTVTKDEFENNK